MKAEELMEMFNNWEHGCYLESVFREPFEGRYAIPRLIGAIIGMEIPDKYSAGYWDKRLKIMEAIARVGR